MRHVALNLTDFLYVTVIVISLGFQRGIIFDLRTCCVRRVQGTRQRHLSIIQALHIRLEFVKEVKDFI